MNDVIAWLESPEGERWSRGFHKWKRNLVIIKDDSSIYFETVWIAS